MVSWLEVPVRVAVGGAGFVIVVGVGTSALRSVVLPRGVPSPLTSAVLRSVRAVFLIPLGRGASYQKRDRVLAPLAPFTLIALLLTWLTMYWVGFGAMQWSIDSATGVRHAAALSGSSLVTLGTVAPHGSAETGLAFLEAGFGLISTALLISYLPTLYGAFSRRESFVAKLEVRAGSPPTGTELLVRAWRIGRLDRLTRLWEDAESWFVELEESHTSYPVLSFFRSPAPELGWTIAAGAVLDGAALRIAAVDEPAGVEPPLALRAGWLALRGIASYFGADVDNDPLPTDPITVSRVEFDTACAELAASGVPLKPDRDQSWADFAGWRVNYDTSLLALSEMINAPYAPWSSDRNLASRAGARMVGRRRRPFRIGSPR